MRKATLRSAWEDILGFNKTTRQYIRLDGDAWLDAHGIRAEGENRGKKNQPGPDERLPDAMYQRIESWVRKRALDCKEEINAYVLDELAHLHDLRAVWTKENPEIDLDALVAQRRQNLFTQAEQSVGDLDKQRAEYEDATRDLTEFRTNHRLSRVAHYPVNPVAHWLWVPVAGIVESFASANLLGSVSRGGIIEGWMVAIVLTVVNILVGIWAGRAWRYTNHNWWGFVKMFAFAQGALCVGIAAVWNDVAGHVRDVYVLAEKTGALEAPDKAFATAYRTMIERPMPWESLPSAGLALVGFAVFVLTAFKAYTTDDPFPGYGAKHRKVTALHERYQKDLNGALAKLRTARDQANVAIEEIKDRYEIDRAGWENAVARLEMVVQGYPANLRLYNNDLAYLLAAYRTANLARRTAPAPSFFDSEPTIDEDVLQPPEFTIPSAPEWGDIPGKAKIGFDEIGNTFEELLKRYKMLDRIVDDYAEEGS